MTEPRERQQLVVRIDRELLGMLRVVRRRTGRSIQAIVEQAVREWFDAHREEDGIDA